MTCPVCRRSLAAHIVEFIGASGRRVQARHRAVSYRVRCDLPSCPLTSRSGWAHERWHVAECSTPRYGASWCTCRHLAGRGPVLYPPAPDDWWTDDDVAGLFRDLTHPLEAVPA